MEQVEAAWRLERRELPPKKTKTWHIARRCKNVVGLPTITANLRSSSLPVYTSNALIGIRGTHAWIVKMVLSVVISTIYMPS
jgi:hypothetical protein